MDSIALELVKTLVPIGGTLVTALVSAGIFYMNRWLKAKAGNEILSVVGHAVSSVVNDLAVNTVEDLKKAAVDGKLTPEEALMVRSQAVNRVKNQLPLHITKIASKTVGDIDAYLIGKIEQEVRQTK